MGRPGGNIENRDLPDGKVPLPSPSLRLIESCIKSVPKYDLAVRRHGADYARKNFRGIKGHYKVDKALERVEFDHTPVNVIVLDDVTMAVLGKMWISAIIDCNTRCLLAVYLSFDPPSYLSVQKCLRMAITPKDLKEHEKYGANNYWEAHGIMRELVVDNGLEFHSNSLESACGALGIELHYCERKAGWSKGHIESVLGTYNQSLINELKGTTFSNVTDKGAYDSAGNAVITESTLRKITYLWVNDIYHQDVHSTLMMPPADKWRESIKLEDIKLPDTPNFLDAVLGTVKEKSLTFKGIEYANGFYNSNDLVDLRKRFGEKLNVKIKVDESDLKSIIVLSPYSDEIFRVNSLRPEYTSGLSLYRHKKIREFLLKRKMEYSTENLLMAKELIRNLIVEDQLDLKKKKTRRGSARWSGHGERAAIHSAVQARPMVTPESPIEVETESPLIEPDDDYEIESETRNRKNNGAFK